MRAEVPSVARSKIKGRGSKAQEFVELMRGGGGAIFFILDGVLLILFM